MPDDESPRAPDPAIATPRIALSGAVLLATVCVAILAVLGLLVHWHIAVRGGSGAALDAPIAGARLETAPQPDLDRYLAGKRRQLDSYGWVDPARHVAHIPIDAAMKLLVEQASAPGAQP